MSGPEQERIRSTGPVLSVRNLTTSFLVDGEWKPVVRDVSFSVAPGETVAIVGEPGSGKSVTSLSIMRLLQPELSWIVDCRMKRGTPSPAASFNNSRRRDLINCW